MPDPIRVTARPRQQMRVQTRYVIPAPEAGWSLEMQRTDTHLEVRQVRDAEVTPWMQVIALAELAGPPGAVPVFAVVDGALAYRFGDSGPWGQLLTIESLKGNDGLSAYQLWVKAGNVGTVVEFLASLKGETPELPSFVASSTVGVVGSVPTVAAEEVDGEVRFRFVLPPPRDGTSPPPLSLSVTSSEVAQGQPITASLSGSYPNLTLALGLRAGSPGTQGGIGPQGASGMPNVDLVGTGMPNGVVTASPGTVYRDTFASGGLLGTNGASQWIKVSGTGSSGWSVLRGDTGWRNILALVTTHTGMIYTVAKVRRINDLVSVNAGWQSIPNSSTVGYGQQIWTMPAGFVPEVDDATSLSGDGNTAGQFFIRNGTEPRVKTTAAPWVRGTLLIPTAQAWPTTLPGVPG